MIAQDGLTLSGLTVEYTGVNNGNRFVCAAKPIPKDDMFYYEVTISALTYASIGFATNQMPERAIEGVRQNTYEYDNFGNGVKSREFVVGDVVGCGVNFKTGKFFYTKKGELLHTANLPDDSAVALYPCIKLRYGTKIGVNFGSKGFNFRRFNDVI
ncbi:Ran-binding protein 9 [Globodera pallida]|nr:Ran-binding protein 9 [Globodera pallida]